MMKNKIVLFSLIAAANLCAAQVAIGKSSVGSPALSLDFAYTAGDAATQRGLLLPRVSSRASVAGAVPGTLVYDATDKKVYLASAGGSWRDLTTDTTGTADVSLQTGLTEAAAAKVNIGTTNEGNVPGILVLSDKNKAMMLPKVDSYSSVISPSAGMLVYDVANGMLCFYNGSVWSFWKP